MYPEESVSTMFVVIATSVIASSVYGQMAILTQMLYNSMTGKEG